MHKGKWRDVALVALGSIAGALAVWWFVGRDAPPVSVAPVEQEPAIGDVVSESDVVAEDTTLERPRSLMERHSAWRGDWKPEGKVEPAVAPAAKKEIAAEPVAVDAARFETVDGKRVLWKNPEAADAIATVVVTPSVIFETLWEGAVPAQKNQALPKNVAAHCRSSEVWEDFDIIPRDYAIYADRLADVFVYVENPRLLASPVTPEPLSLVINACRFLPDVLGVQQRQELMVINQDPLLHNVHASVGGHTFANKALVKQGQTAKLRFLSRMRRVDITDDVHPFMNATAFVLDHAYFAVTDRKGEASIAGLHAGEYTVVAVHPKLPEQRQTIRYDGRAAKVSFTFRAPTIETTSEKLSAR